MSEHFVLGDVKYFEQVQPAPSGWLVEAGDGNLPAVVLHDELFTDRATNIDETNEIIPFRPVENGVVSPQGKIIVDTEGAWFDWMVALNGETNATAMLKDGDGFFDTASKYGMGVFATAGQLVNIIETISQNGNKYSLCETHDHSSPPVKDADGIWRYKGEPQSWQTYPHLFTSRVNRRKTQIEAWQTWNGTEIRVLSVTDARKGDEHWPTPANKAAAIQNMRLKFYPELPFKGYYKPDSWVIDGVLQTRPEYAIELIYDAYLFCGSETWGR